LVRGLISDTQHGTGRRYAALCWRVRRLLSPRSCIANLVSRGLVPLAASPPVNTASRVDERAEGALRAADHELGPDAGFVRDVAVMDDAPTPAQLPQLRAALNRLSRFWEEGRRRRA
jgi:hypothetical protein